MDVVPRDLQFALAQALITASLYLLLYSRPYALLSTLVITALISLTATAWVPSILGAIILGFGIGAVPGLALGTVLVISYDTYEAELTGAPIEQRVYDVEGLLPVDDYRVGSGRTLLQARTGRFFMVIGCALIIIGHILAIAGADTSIVALAFLNALFTGAGATIASLTNRNVVPLRVAWATLGAVSVGAIFVVSITIHGTQSTAWSTCALLGYILFAAAASHLVTAFTSGDFRTAAGAVWQTFSEPVGPTHHGTPMPPSSVSPAPPPPSHTPVPPVRGGKQSLEAADARMDEGNLFTNLFRGTPVK